MPTTPSPWPGQTSPPALQGGRQLLAAATASPRLAGCSTCTPATASKVVDETSTRTALSPIGRASRGSERRAASRMLPGRDAHPPARLPCRAARPPLPATAWTSPRRVGMPARPVQRGLNARPPAPREAGRQSSRQAGPAPLTGRWNPAGCHRRPARSHRLRPLPSPAGDLGDLHAYDPVARSWTDLSTPAAGFPPVRRDSHGFAAARGLLYVHAGQNQNGAGARGVGRGRWGRRRSLANCGPAG